MIWSTGIALPQYFGTRGPSLQFKYDKNGSGTGQNRLRGASEKDNAAEPDQRVGILNRGESHCDLDIDLMLDFTLCFI
jgi:hypothetical protein